MQNSGEKGKNLDEKKRSGLTNQIAFQRLTKKQTRSRTYFLLQYIWKIIAVQPANDLYLSLPVLRTSFPSGQKGTRRRRGWRRKGGTGGYVTSWPCAIAAACLRTALPSDKPTPQIPGCPSAFCVKWWRSQPPL